MEIEYHEVIKNQRWGELSAMQKREVSKVGEVVLSKKTL